jgi:UDP-N-acetylmuramyl pentapeptide synthase
MMLKGSEIIEMCGGTLLQGNPEQQVSGFAIDSRLVRAGDFFIPLKASIPTGIYILPALLKAALQELSRSILSDRSKLFPPISC